MLPYWESAGVVPEGPRIPLTRASSLMLVFQRSRNPAPNSLCTTQMKLPLLMGASMEHLPSRRFLLEEEGVETQKYNARRSGRTSRGKPASSCTDTEAHRSEGSLSRLMEGRKWNPSDQMK